ncbi:MAG TPA: HAMP domain-containing sensor histidine kinase, partial [Flavipsychrobacter sp.]|nr:HAMP domain-containing sensor histidine kinase [Flavipsychrobacter sp.]
MTERVQKDYLSLKEFTGHAAHEMQTPLAVIRTKLDILMQNETLLKHDTAQITDIEKAVHKLSRLYQSLLLLTKVENRQFILNEDVHLDKIIKDKCAEFWEMIEAKGIKVKLYLEPVPVFFHQHLAEIIISNLLNNAIRYNREKGTIEIILQPDYLSIANTSNFAELDKEKVFQRFYRHQGAQDEGNGLGLSIIKQICDFAGYTLVYQYISGEHLFKIIFNK